MFGLYRFGSLSQSTTKKVGPLGASNPNGPYCVIEILVARMIVDPRREFVFPWRTNNRANDNNQNHLNAQAALV
ncbi:MAG: hypothetical protein QOG73_2075 [Acetobacteraceae bacterium]|jgi:hypothetical protein|nr:hypothetical protein [Acetobacteraceae bacterium]